MSKLSFAACLLMCAAAAQAQIHKMERGDTVAHAYSLNPVVVTGSGHHQRLKSTATPVHVLSEQEIREQGITTFDGALQCMMPQVSMAPNSMGSQLRLNGLGNKYILILVNGQKLSGDISNNVDLNRINMTRVKRIEVLDGAASSLYGSDAIAGVINIITDQPTQNLLSVTNDTRVSGHGVLTENVTLDIYNNGFGSYTSFSHDRADSYRNNDLEYVSSKVASTKVASDLQSDADAPTQKTIAPLFTGYRANILGQKFTYTPTQHLALNAAIDYSYKITDRPDTRPDITGGTDYEMRYKGLRWNLGAIYKITDKNSLQANFTVDRFRYGKEYDVATKEYAVGDYVQSKKQRMMDGELKAILNLFGAGRASASATTILGADWRKDYLVATAGNIDQHVYNLAAYAQHEQKFRVGPGSVTATFGARLSQTKLPSRSGGAGGGLSHTGGAGGGFLTPKATLMYSQGPVNLRATYSAGFRSPGLDELYYHYFSVNRGKAQISFGNQDLSPEKSHYLSLNAEYRSSRLAVSVTGYMNRIKDMVVKQNIPIEDDGSTLQMLMAEFPEMTQEQADKIVSYARYQNSDKGDVKGLQLNLSANLFRGFNLTANYAYTYARTLEEGSGEVSVWLPLERSIRHSATIAANYALSIAKCAMLNVNLNGRLQSKTYYTDPYENAPGYGVWNLSTTLTKLPSRSGGAGGGLSRLGGAGGALTLGIDNIFNRVDNRIDSSTRKYALYSPGRMLTLGLRVKLNH